MVAPYAEFFDAIASNSLAKAAIERLVSDNITALTDSLRGAVRQGDFHRAVGFEGQLTAWEMFWPEIETRAQSYKPPATEGRA